MGGRTVGRRRSRPRVGVVLGAVGLGIVAFAPPGGAGGAPNNGVNDGQDIHAGVGAPGRTVTVAVDVGTGGGGGGDGGAPATCTDGSPAEWRPAPPVPGAADIGETLWYKHCLPEDGQPYPDYVEGSQWWPDGEGPAGADPGPSATDVRDALWAEVEGRLQAPQVSLDPPERDAAGNPARSVIHVPTFFAITNPQPATRYVASAAGLEVWIDVWPDVHVHPGEDGAPTIPCDDDGSTYDPDAGPPSDQVAGACAHPYAHRTGFAGRGPVWNGDVTIDWEVAWDSNVPNQQGTIDAAPGVTPFVRQVEEVQSVVDPS